MKDDPQKNDRWLHPGIYLGVPVFVIGELMSGTKDTDTNFAFQIFFALAAVTIFIFFLWKSRCDLGTKIMMFIVLCAVSVGIVLAIAVRSFQVG